ncbi:MAG: helix-turn-helix domain containing protein [Parvibaculaceae bacterium]|nr:helix-turn-helix domain containing protein [Parvibaculaceae bacterium]
MAARKTTEDKIIDAALQLSSEEGWGRFSLADVAQRAKMPLADLHGIFSGKRAILAAFSRRVDVRVLRAVDPEDQEGERPKDRLFDVLMLRFDELGAYKDGVRAISRDLARDPFGLLAGARPALRSMHWMLEAASIDSGGMFGAVRARALGVVWLAAFRVWLDDEPGLGKTMSELDKRLQQSVALWGDTAAPEVPPPRANAAE